MVEYDSILFFDYIETAKQLNHKLWTLEKCDFVFALTHFWLENDQEFAWKVPEIDLILGGHDHDYDTFVERDSEGNQAGELVLVKSGCDFRELSLIELSPFTEED